MARLHISFKHMLGLRYSGIFSTALFVLYPTVNNKRATSPFSLINSSSVEGPESSFSLM